MKKDLSKLAAEIRQLLKAAADGNRTAAALIWQSKQCFDSSLAWLAWTAKSFGFSRRSTFLYAKVGEFFARRPDMVRIAALSDFTKVEILANLGDRLDEFIAGRDLEELSRDELRDAAAEFLGKPRASAPNPYTGLPSPEQLELALGSATARAAIKPDRELAYITAHWERFTAVVDQVSPETLLAVATRLRAASDSLLNRLPK